MAEERRRPEPDKEAPAKDVPLPVKKKKQGGGCFSKLMLLLLLIFGGAAGLHFSGLWDGRPLLWGLMPKIPYIGAPMAAFFKIPEEYSLTVEERRKMEMESWQKRLDEREKLISQDKTLLEALSGDLESKAQSLSEKEQALSAQKPVKKDENTTEEEQKLINQVAKTYQDMSPRNAAQIVEKLRENLAVDLLNKLPVDARASILGKMTPQKAARLTEIMAVKQK